jgi:hypothetical protein
MRYAVSTQTGRFCKDALHSKAEQSPHRDKSTANPLVLIVQINAEELRRDSPAAIATAGNSLPMWEM